MRLFPNDDDQLELRVQQLEDQVAQLWQLVQRQPLEPNGEPDGFVQPTWQPQSVSDDPVWLPEVRALVGRDRKIEAIKRVREYTGWGLAEAKQYVDRL